MPIPGEWIQGQGNFSDWYEYFAWAPVRTIDGTKVWLRTVYCREFYPDTPVLPTKMLQYVTKEKLAEMRLRGDRI